MEILSPIETKGEHDGQNSAMKEKTSSLAERLKKVRK
jgi:hypothetical protein